MSDTENTQDAADGGNARPPRTRTRTRTTGGDSSAKAAPSDAAAKAEKADAPAARAPRKRTPAKAKPVAKADSKAAAKPEAAAKAAPKPRRAPSKTAADAPPKADDAQKAEQAASADEPVRRRTRTRAGAGSAASGEGAKAADDKPQSVSKAGSKAAPKTTAKAKSSGAAKSTAAKKPAAEEPTKTRTRPPAASKAASEDTQASDAPQADAQESGDDSPAVLKRTRRGRRGGRNRNRNRRPGVDTAEERILPDPGDTDTAEHDDSDESSTRMQSQARARRGSTVATGRGRATGANRRPVPGVSDEVRRVIAESPPRRMLVTVGDERTQVAVLEERTLVEHYVTRKQDVSYVGNIYLGRVQNVLPGMEAAFVDIGKGRNGVLYAGEVNYDEGDLDGDVPRIEEQLKAGQSVLVQVTKDPMGTKGARLTQHLSIAGRYCVLAPGEGMLGISRKLPDDERERLRVILKAIRPDGYGLIVRTAAEGATREQLEADVSRLVRIWEQVDERAKKAKALDTVYEEPDLVIRVIRDVFGPEYSELIVDNAELATQIREYLGDVSPELVDRVQAYTPQVDEDETPAKLFEAYEVTNQIRRALERKVWLKSGGYLIVEKTEAMWVIDVNTGKFVGERNLEATVLKNNLEAADEIARQLRLRDMGGIIVIDFVDMLVPANRDEVLKRFKRELARDKTKSRVMEISKLGLVQMTRKNVSVGLQESFTSRCEVCEGRGAKIVEHIA